MRDTERIERLERAVLGLVNIIHRQDCSCTLRERASGHQSECDKPQTEEALQKIIDALKRPAR
jgi:hypothetical protein